MNMKMMSKCIFVPKSCISYFILFSLFSILSYFIFLSQLTKLVYQDCKQHVTCQRGNKRFDVHLRRIRTVHFLSKDGKGASYDGRDGWKSCLFPAKVGICNFDVILLDSTFPYLYLDLACKQLCFPPGKGINRRNESTRHNFFFWWSTDDSIPVLLNFLHCIFCNC